MPALVTKWIVGKIETRHRCHRGSIHITKDLQQVRAQEHFLLLGARSARHALRCFMPNPTPRAAAPKLASGVFHEYIIMNTGVHEYMSTWVFHEYIIMSRHEYMSTSSWMNTGMHEEHDTKSWVHMTSSRLCLKNFYGPSCRLRLQSFFLFFCSLSSISFLLGSRLQALIHESKN